MSETNKMHIAGELSRAYSGKSILLIDTDEVNHELHRLHLKKYNIKLQCSKSLRHALWLVQENPPDLILTEIFFNGHLNYEHLFLLRYRKEIPIIVQSCQLSQWHSGNCLIRGAEGYFTKPLHWDKYLLAIFCCLQAKY